MYKFTLFIFLLLITCTACKKTSNEDKLKASVVARWSYSSLVESQYAENGNLNYASNVSGIQSGDYMEFKANGTWTSQLGGPSGSIGSGTYIIQENNTFTLYNGGVANPCRDLKVTGNSLSFIVVGPKYKGYGYTEYLHTFKK